DQAWYERMERGRAGKADPDPPGLAARGPFCGGGRMLARQQERPRFGEQRLAGLRQLDAARQSAEQLYVELGLKRPDLLAQRRWLGAEGAGRGGRQALLRE